MVLPWWNVEELRVFCKPEGISGNSLGERKQNTVEQDGSGLVVPFQSTVDSPAHGVFSGVHIMTEA